MVHWCFCGAIDIRGLGNTNNQSPNFSRTYFFLPTDMPRVNPAKAWCFTLNNYSENERGALVQRFSDLDDKYYFIVGCEIGESGTPHLQGYIEKREGRFRPLPCFEILRDGKNAMHFERAKGNRKQNYNYCSKDGDFITNIDKPIMTYSEAKAIWKETNGISNDKFNPATINEAAMHIEYMELYDCYTNENQRKFMVHYNAMMKVQYPERIKIEIDAEA